MTTAINEVNAALMKAVSAAKEETLDEVLDIIDAKQLAIQKLLEGGYPILSMTFGKRFDKLYEQRQKLWRKHKAYGEIYVTIAEIRLKY